MSKKNTGSYIHKETKGDDCNIYDLYNFLYNKTEIPISSGEIRTDNCVWDIGDIINCVWFCQTLLEDKSDVESLIEYIKKLHPEIKCDNLDWEECISCIYELTDEHLTDEFEHNFDVSGKPVKIGDKVSFTVPYYKNLTIGTVVKITPKGFSIDFGRTNYKGKPEYLFRSCDQVCLVERVIK